MKKIAMPLLFWALVAGAAFAQAPAKKVSVSFNAGLQVLTWSDVVASHVTMDVRAGIRLARAFEISPEVMLAFQGGSYHLPAARSCVYPGVMANYMARHVFAGLGFVVPFQEYRPRTLSPKANVGFVFGHLVLTAHVILSRLETGDPDSNPFFGVSAGYRF